ncbi:MAG: hypothetical protein R3F07_04570 [Opitutaceae bacterium]
MNGRRVLSVNGDQINADPSIAPPAHRAGPAVTALKLKGPGPHELLVGFEKPTNGMPADLVIGLADHGNHLWLTDVATGIPERAST